MREVVIAGGLITVGSGLLSTRRGLITLRTRLVSLRERPILISHRLLVLYRVQNRSDALLLSAGPPVAGMHGITA